VAVAGFLENTLASSNPIKTTDAAWF